MRVLGSDDLELAKIRQNRNDDNSSTVVQGTHQNSPPENENTENSENSEDSVLLSESREAEDVAPIMSYKLPVGLMNFMQFVL